MKWKKVENQSLTDFTVYWYIVAKQNGFSFARSILKYQMDGILAK